eukprot:TRINITY_DN732_c0_g1_i5.p2 TRINITY_DN732_c0_g1~~TRINITY_DN732_c0_g1_i5.p2  ORF type:complete len:106 (-),score=19.34 TRINITY_DN732_c0_g1_i5:410-727(-)
MQNIIGINIMFVLPSDLKRQFHIIRESKIRMDVLLTLINCLIDKKDAQDLFLGTIIDDIAAKLVLYKMKNNRIETNNENKECTSSLLVQVSKNNSKIFPIPLCFQ